jgi:hypothetical protein
MTNQEYSIAPPPELVQQWIGDYYGCPVSGELAGVETAIATHAAQWGADQELEACREWLCEAKNHGLGYEYGQELADRYRAARRPKPLSLKEQALALLIKDPSRIPNAQEWDTIRRALETLPE